MTYSFDQPWRLCFCRELKKDLQDKPTSSTAQEKVPALNLEAARSMRKVEIFVLFWHLHLIFCSSPRYFAHMDRGQSLETSKHPLEPCSIHVCHALGLVLNESTCVTKAAHYLIFDHFVGGQNGAH